MLDGGQAAWMEGVEGLEGSRLESWVGWRVLGWRAGAWMEGWLDGGCVDGGVLLDGLDGG